MSNGRYRKRFIENFWKITCWKQRNMNLFSRKPIVTLKGLRVKFKWYQIDLINFLICRLMTGNRSPLGHFSRQPKCLFFTICYEQQFPRFVEPARHSRSRRNRFRRRSAASRGRTAIGVRFNSICTGDQKTDRNAVGPKDTGVVF